MRFRVELAALALALPLTSAALTTSDVMSQIQALMQQVTALQSQMGQPTAPAPVQMPDQSSVPASAQSSLSLATQTASPQGYCPNFSHALSRGAQGTEVMFLQRYLLGQGLLTADSLTGYFGTQTEKALQSLQTQYGVVSSGAPATTGWGVLGKKTMRLVALNCKAQASASASTQSDEQGQCPIAAHPATICSGTWQAVSGANGCTSAWRCVIPIPGSSQAATSSPATGSSQCPIAPRPTTYCSGSWSALSDSAGCTVAWQCAMPITQTTSTSCPTVIPTSGNCMGSWQPVYAGGCQAGWQCVAPSQATPAIQVTVQPSTARRGSAPRQGGDTIQILWSSRNVPADAAVSLWLEKSGGTESGLIAGGLSTDGNYNWQVPGPQCDSLGNCTYIADSPRVYYVDPGSYAVTARLYSPHDAALGGFAPASATQPKIAADSVSNWFSITVPSALSKDAIDNLASTLAALEAGIKTLVK